MSSFLVVVSILFYSVILFFMRVKEINSAERTLSNSDQVHFMWVLYLFSFFKMFLIIMPVIVPFFQSLGMSMTQVMQAQAVFALTVAAMEIPTGYIADRFGKRLSIFFGALLYAGCFTGLTFVDSFFGILIYEVMIGIAMGFVNGADISLIYENFKGKTTQLDKNVPVSVAFANYQLAVTLGESTAAVLSGFLVSYGLRSVVLAQAIFGWMPVVLSLLTFKFLAEPTASLKKDTHKIGDLKIFLKSVLQKESLAIRLLLALVGMSLSSFIAVWLLQKYWEVNGIGYEYFGLLWAGLNLSTGLIGKWNRYILNQVGAKGVLWLIGGLPVVSYLALAFVPVSIGLVFCFGFYLSRGLTQVFLKDHYNRVIPSEFRATANSLPSYLCLQSLDHV
ncbi:MAG: MFS transporter [Proteobacteria bacterium]|nr:MFS transporter [Pseudomonadota bacterium]